MKNRTKYPAPTFDVTVSNQGSVFLFTSQTLAVRSWVQNHLGLEGWQWLGGGFAIDTRYAGNIVEALWDNGFSVGDA